MALEASLLDAFARQQQQQQQQQRPPRALLVRASAAACLLLGLTALLGRSSKAPRTLETQLLSASAPGTGRYARAQYLGFQIFTVPGTAADGCFASQPGDEATEDECYLGTASVAADLQGRLRIMRAAIERAHASSHWDRRSSTLKVFMAPEFYWRGARGAYRLWENASLVLIKDVARSLESMVSDPSYADWLFVFGTLILAEPADPAFVSLLPDPSHNISYYNVAPIFVGGTGRRLLEFKHYISGVDFIQHSPGNLRTPPLGAAPGSGTEFCKANPNSNGCVYSTLPDKVLRQLGFDEYEVVKGNSFKVENLRIGIEVCLDHLEGQLGKALGPERLVDLQLITSAGMAIRFGPVCTASRGPVFLSDGFAEASVGLNEFGQGRRSAEEPSGEAYYDVGMTYDADTLMGLNQMVGDTVSALTGNGVGTTAAGRASEPGGSAATGTTGIGFTAISALGDEWRSELRGFYDVSGYRVLTELKWRLASAEKRMTDAASHRLWGRIQVPFTEPTVDFFGPFDLPSAR
mmetsp:Transcript_93158/g.259496  ORF Transcript_93158/g.259496 Transcript_93158/m.259496 type:complete len:522 (+) Transcript_93158:55-1620(+)